MKGLIALVGSGEYLPVMDDVDRTLLDSVRGNGGAPRVVCLPTAAGREGDQTVHKWMKMGEAHFRALGGDVTALPMIDRSGAADPAFAGVLEEADLIYFSGGSPTYLYQTLAGSKAWSAAEHAWDRGAVYAGCSAGAMILAQKVPDIRRMGGAKSGGFAVLSAYYIVPHFDHSGPFRPAIQLMQRLLPEDQYILGIDEATALVGRLGGTWQVMGKGRVHILRRSETASFRAGATLTLPNDGGA
jgi:cyanophycinase